MTGSRRARTSSQRQRTGFISASILAFAVLAASQIAALALPAPHADDPCPGFQVVPAQGPSCPAPGGWQLLLAGGATILTHGPDYPEAVAAGPATFEDREMPTCVADPTDPDEAYALLIYAYPPPSYERGDSGLPQIALNDLSSTGVPELRDMVNRSNAYLASEAGKFGADMSFKFACDAPDTIRVDVVGLLAAFGRAGPQGMFWRTRADDMAVKVVREVLRRNPQLPPERIGEPVESCT